MTHFPPDNSAVSETAFESVSFAVVNAGLEQKMLGRHPDEYGRMTRLDPPRYPQPEYEAQYSFQHACLPFEARVQTHFGGAELSFCAWLLSKDTPAGTEALPGSKLSDGFDVIASGWLERESGFYLHRQSSPRELQARRHLRPILKSFPVRIRHFHVRRPVGCATSRREHA